MSLIIVVDELSAVPGELYVGLRRSVSFGSQPVVFCSEDGRIAPGSGSQCRINLKNLP